MNNKESEGLMRKNNKCPVFSGKADEYVIWKCLVEDWMTVVGKEENVGLQIRMSVQGKPLAILVDIERKELMKKNGYKLIFEKLDRMYLREEGMNRIEKLKEFLKIEKEKDENMREYVLRYEKVYEECKKVGGGTMSEAMKGTHVLMGAKLNERDQHIILGACGNKNYDYEEISRALCRIFSEKEKEKIEKCWVSDEGEKKEKKNPLNRFGKRMKCTKCRSEEHFMKECKEKMKCWICKQETHWAMQCPKNWRNLGEEKERERKNENKGEKVHNYLCSDEKEDLEIGDIEAILDTGCPRSVIGKL